jgi:hypothetical protein
MISNTDTTPWGAPNVDNKYHRARINPSSSYTLFGNAKHLHDIAIQTNAGDMHQGKLGASETVDLSQLTIDAEGNFALRVSANPQEGDWLELDPEHTILSMRSYLVHWASNDFGKSYLVEAGKEGRPPDPLPETETAARLGRAASWIESNVVGWERWFDTILLTANKNEAIAPTLVEGESSYSGISAPRTHNALMCRWCHIQHRFHN